MRQAKSDPPATPVNDARNLVIGVVASLIAMAIGGIAVVVWPAVFAQAITLPLWGYLTLLTLAFVGFGWTVAFFRRQLRHQASDHQKSISELASDHAETIRERDADRENLEHILEQANTELGSLRTELRKEREFVYEGGLYYRATDTERKQPFCRVCRESRNTLTTVVDFWTNKEREPVYLCSSCQESYKMTAPIGHEDDGEDIPL
jgi:hypothetical protein